LARYSWFYRRCCLPGAVFLHDAVAHPLTADAAQVLMGSTCLAFALLLVVYLVRERR